MLTRRRFFQYLLGSTVSILAPCNAAGSNAEIFCAAAVDPADAQFYPLGSVDWKKFYLNDVPTLFDKCCHAMGVEQIVLFSDELPVQASWNSISPDQPTQPRMYIGVGNLEAYPFSTLIAVILHELGHVFCYKSYNYKKIVEHSEKKQRELLADFMAGSAFAKMESLHLSTNEEVHGQCSTIVLPWEVGPEPKPVISKKNSLKITLNAHRLLATRISSTHFQVLRRDGKIEDLQNYSMIGTMPDEDPEGVHCTTVHHRPVDFVAMVAAVSSWRTFGDLPDTEESHGSPSERYQAFSYGFEKCRSERLTLEECLNIGIPYLGIHL